MALLKIYANKSSIGFTLVEVAIAMGLIAAIASMGLLANMESLRKFAFSNDCNAVMASLARARSLAMNNTCFGSGCLGGKPHGVHFDPAKKEFVIFQGGDFIGRDQAIDEIIKFDTPAMMVDAAAAFDVVFDRLSGNSATQSIFLKDSNGNIIAILINNAGQIDWQ